MRERESPGAPGDPIHEGMNETAPVCDFPSGSPDAGGARLSDLSRPIGARVLVKKALDEYLAENGFDVREYTKPTVRLKVLGRYFDFPNTKARQWAIPLHDLHHVATGYGTDWVGEAEIGVWELRAGCRTAMVYYLNAMAVLIGLFVSPGRVLAAYRAAGSARSLYRAGLSYEQALGMTAGELRAHLGIPAEGIATGGRRLHTDAQAKRDERTGAMSMSAA